jgi:predicted ATPase
MSGFKLIGIRPHEDCGSQFLKILDPGRLYQFYNEFVFYTKKGKFDGVNGEINHYDFIKDVPEDLYNVGELNVNISAIVGKNGTGKSTLIELLLYANYLIGITFKDENTGQSILPKYADLLKDELNVIQKTYDSQNESIEKYKSYIANNLKRISKSSVRRKFFKEKIWGYINEIELLSAQQLGKKKHLRYLKLESLLSDEDGSEKNRNYRCSLVFSMNSHIYEMSFKDEIELFEITKSNRTKENSIDLKKHFFYSTILNYSHHSLNSNHLGYWINSLFHKNDGYKTPAVINPMRNEGNFDINKEIELSKSRLLVNSLINQLNNTEEPVYISEKHYINSIQVKRKDNSSYKQSVSLKRNNASETFIISGQIIGVNTIHEILNTNGLEDFANFGYEGKLNSILEDLMNYLVNKVHRIQNHYPEYFKKVNSIVIEDADQIAADRNTIEKLNSDNSHVSFKYQRSIFFLKKIIKGELDKYFSENETEITLSLTDYLNEVNLTNEDDVFEMFLRVPPPIFEVDFNLTQLTSSKTEKCSFEGLSSGEQQSIHTINTFIYHLNNTYSVHKASLHNRQKYECFNAVFDEIELYFHPDLQRKFINDLLITLRNNKHLHESPLIKDINIIFSTHSPFILSDIPSSNILRLKSEFSSPEKSQTFGSNIHDLLANDFFLEDGFMGEFAKIKIDETIRYLNSKILDNKLTELKELLNDDKIEETEKLRFSIELKQTKKEFDSLDVKNNNREYHLKLIDQIGEPVLRNKLREMAASIMPIENKKKYLAEQFNIMAKNAGVNINDIKF